MGKSNDKYKSIHYWDDEIIGRTTDGDLVIKEGVKKRNKKLPRELTAEELLMDEYTKWYMDAVNPYEEAARKTKENLIQLGLYSDFDEENVLYNGE